MSLAIKQNDHPQVKDRRFRVYTDPHGRKWEAQVSKTTDKPVDPLRPRGWRPPVKGGLPPHRYLRPTNDLENPTLLAIDYDGIIAEYKRIDADWQRLFMREGRRLHKGEFDPTHPSDELMDLVGPRPFPWQYWQACKDPNAVGHEWALGRDPEWPDWAHQFFTRHDDAADFLYRTPDPVPSAAPVTAKPRKGPSGAAA